MSKRVLAMALAILAFFIFVGSPFGQSAKAVVGVDDAIIAIVIVALAALGITFVTTGAYDSLKEYVAGLLQEFASSQNVSVGSLLSGTQSGTNSAGKLLLNNRFLLVIDTFAKWLKLKYSLGNNSSVILQNQELLVAHIPCVELPIRYTDAHRIIDIVAYDSGSAVYAFKDNNGRMTFFGRSHNVAIYEYKWNGVLDRAYTYELTNPCELWGVQYQLNGWYAGAFTDNTAGFFDVPKSDFDTSMSYLVIGNSDIVNSEEISVITGVIEIPTENPDYTEGDGAVIDLQVGWGSSYDDVIDEIEGAFTDDGYAEPTITYEGEEEVQEQVEDTPAQSVSSDAEQYQVIGLQDVFPFCIPFDIYAFFECLAAEPEAPSFTWRFYIPGICDEDLEIDLAAFDSAARILRTMELLLFIVGLAFVTRDKFLRG